MTPTPIFLRLESLDGTVAEEYRIRGGRVEMREWSAVDGECSDWTILMPEALQSRVYRNRALAQWLERRLGWRKAVRACASVQLLESDSAQNNYSDQQAA